MSKPQVLAIYRSDLDWVSIQNEIPVRVFSYRKCVLKRALCVINMMFNKI